MTSASGEQPWERIAVTVIVGAFVVLGIIYSIVTPVFEASDELWHYPVVQHLAQGKGLPVQDPAQAQLWRQEGSQPPLYYALGAFLTWWVDTSDLYQVRRLNPHADIGVLTDDGNVNMTVHSDREAFPYHGTTLAVHIVRWLSVLLGAITVTLTYHITRSVAPETHGAGVLAAALVAFNPMFLFISGSVNNDNLVVTLCTLALWLTLRLDENGLTVRRCVVLGVVSGLAVLTKANAIALIGLAGLALVAACWHERSWQRFTRCGIAIIVPVLVIAGWWLVRNWSLYGDPLGLNMLVEITGARHPQPTLWQLAGEWQGFLWSYWGLFGGLNVALEAWTYAVFNLLAIAALLGLVCFAWRCLHGSCRVNGIRLFILAVWPVTVFVALIRWTLMTPASQGRLLFSAIAAISTLLALGLVQWIPAEGRRIGAGVLAGALCVIAVVVPFRIIAPAYAPPPLLDSAAIAAVPERLDVTFGSGIKLLGYQMDEEVIQPGDRLPVTLYWEATIPIDQDYSVFVHLLAENDLVVAQRDTYPGRGSMPTSAWPPGEVFADTVVLQVPRTTYAPSQAQIELGVYDFGTGERLPAVTAAGRHRGDNLRFGHITVQPAQDSVIPNPVDFSFEGRLKLSGYELDRRAARPGEKLVLTLYWQALQPVTEDYTVFTHVLGKGETIWAQKDGQPQNGDAPTSSWEAGTLIEDRYELLLRTDTPPDVYEVEVGLYQPESGQRLGVLGEQGRLDADHVVLTTVRVLP